MFPKVAIIYLCHNDLRYVPDVVASWGALSYPKDNLAFIIIPNGAKDGVQNYIENNVLSKVENSLLQVIMIDDGINRGFAGGNNQGITWAIENGFDYVFLNNGDLKLTPNSISELVDAISSDESIGSAQAFVLYWNDNQKVNATGGMIHIAGYGYARHNGKALRDVYVTNKSEIAYCSGAAVMYRLSALKKIGMLEDGFFMYHEDLELGLRLRFAGYKNIIATNAIVHHDYSFNRNPKKFIWMEIYRWDVLLAYPKFRTLILLMPLLIAIEAGVWLMALKGGWLLAKIRASILFWSSVNIKLILKMRKRAQRLRIIQDKSWLLFITGRIEDQNSESRFIRIVNDVIENIWRVAQRKIDW